ncbi:hypothetical protein ACFL2H_07750 [Planctomycetota bacterium]
MLEQRRVLDCQGIAPVELCVPGDSNGDDEFNSQDLIQVFQAAKYNSGSTAVWSEGDWNRDGMFNSSDLVTVFQAATYDQGMLVDDLSTFVAKVPAYSGGFGPPIMITNAHQLKDVIDDRAAVEAIADATDFNRQRLLFFSWSGSGGDKLVGQPTVVDGVVNVELQFNFGLTDDLRQHRGLLAIPKDADWNINIEERTIHEDTSNYEFNGDASTLRVAGGFAGVRDEYTVTGAFTLTRNADGSASFGQVDAILQGDGLSSLDGERLDSVLNLSELTGLQVTNASVAFVGLFRSRVVRLFATVSDHSLTINGGDFPPCCDFFQHGLDATATVQEV